MKHNAKTDMIGRRFGRWLVIGSAPKQDIKKLSWFCVCDCGVERAVVGTELRTGRSSSCGCLANELSRVRMTTHGKTNTHAYYTWSAMLSRCTLKKHPEYKHYGGRGITVCKEWCTFEGFYADMGDPADGMTLDRINNDCGYYPENCRWATKTQQNENRRVTKWIEFDGVRKTQSAWAKQLGVCKSTIARRLKKMSVEQALTKQKAVA